MIKSVAYYIVEDDPSVINVLQDIVEDRNLGTVVGTSGEDGADIDEILMRKADIILVDTTSPSIAPVGEPAAAVVYSACGGDVDTVIINGKTVMAHRVVLTCDEEEAVDNVNQIARQILG